MEEGLLIAVEGMDGCGKSTATALLEEILNDRGISVTKTFEVGGTPVGKELRKLCFSSREDEVIDPVARLFMLEAARIQHIDQVIQPALNRGEVVITDRFTASTRVYQGTIDGLHSHIDAIEDMSYELDMNLNLIPDVVIFLDTAPSLAFARGKARVFVDNDAYKKSEEQALTIRQAYQDEMERIEAETDTRVVTIDVTEGGVEQLRKNLEAIIDDLFVFDKVPQSVEGAQPTEPVGKTSNKLTWYLCAFITGLYLLLGYCYWTGGHQDSVWQIALGYAVTLLIAVVFTRSPDSKDTIEDLKI